jgi:large subunit ribosomal protein L18
VKHERIVQKQRLRRRHRVRQSLRGTAERPRLCVFRSHSHVYCQLIDDQAGRTLVAASSRDKQLRSAIANTSNKQGAVAVGKAIAERALAAGIKQVRFDRGAYQFHGRVAALAEAAREGGLAF